MNMNIERSLEDTSNFLKQHQQSSGVPTSDSWILLHSPISGRGLFAARDLAPGDTIFIDVPLVIGPRINETSAPLCVGCHKSGVALVSCSRGCGLPVCYQGCELSELHRDDCDRLVGWRQGNVGNSTPWSSEMLRALTPIKCLRLDRDQKRFLKCLEAHHGPLHENEVELLKKMPEISIRDEDGEFMRFCCRALDANSFEIAVPQVSPVSADNSPADNVILRGLFPLAAMMNNACTANTRHGFNKEGGSRLSALKCINAPCEGSLLHEDPVQIGSKWACDKCGLKLPDKQVRLINGRLGAMLRAVNCNDPLQISAFLRGHRCLFATTNQAIVEMKSSLVWIYGKQHPYMWQDLSDANLDTKEGLCRELLSLLKVLKAGQCRLRGLFLYELHCTLVEKQRRQVYAVDAEEVSSTIEEAASMFAGDVTAPADIWIRRRAACVTPHNH